MRVEQERKENALEVLQFGTGSVHGKQAGQLHGPLGGSEFSIYACRVHSFLPYLQGSGGGGAEHVWIAQGWVSRDSRKPTASLSLLLDEILDSSSM